MHESVEEWTPPLTGDCCTEVKSQWVSTDYSPAGTSNKVRAECWEAVSVGENKSERGEGNDGGSSSLPPPMKYFNWFLEAGRHVRETCGGKGKCFLLLSYY